MAILNTARSLPGIIGRFAKPQYVSTRGIRQRRKTNEPADFVSDATTYADRQSAILDPHTSLPYAPKDLEENYLDLGQLTRKSYAKAKAKAKFEQRVLLNLNFDHIPIYSQVVLMFPGQGTQHVGMGTKLLDNPSSSLMFEQANEILGYDLLDVCQRGPKTKLDQTKYCQAAVFVSSVAAFEKLKVERPELKDRITAAAGFSVGEYCALVAGGVINFEDALKVIKVRAETMHECCELVPSGMMTVRVTARSRLDEAMKEARAVSSENGEGDVCEIANYLYCGVRVIGGSETALNYLETHASMHQFQVIKRLPVAGAFHTALMQPAEAKVAEALQNITINTPRINVYSNFTGKIHWRRENSIRKCLVKQISAPVKWEQIVQLLFRMHQDYEFPNYIEVGPGRQLGAILNQVSKKAYSAYTNYPC